MIGPITHFASSSPTIYIAPSGLFHLWKFNVTNADLFGWVGTALIVIFLIIVARRMTIRPKGGVIQYIEAAADYIGGTLGDSFEDKERGQKYVLYFVTLFFFLLLTNLLGLIPGVGDSFTFHGLPLLRPLTADFNATLAIAVITMGLVYSSSIKEVGMRQYLKHFFVGPAKNPFYLFLGFIEIITDLTRVVSLSLRLFLNISIVEIIVVVFAWLGHIIAPITATPFYFLDMFDDVLQAFIFVLLGTMYLAITLNHVAEHEHGLTEGSVPETMEAKSG